MTKTDRKAAVKKPRKKSAPAASTKAPKKTAGKKEAVSSRSAGSKAPPAAHLPRTPHAEAMAQIRGIQKQAAEEQARVREEFIKNRPAPAAPPVSVPKPRPVAPARPPGAQTGARPAPSKREEPKKPEPAPEVRPPQDRTVIIAAPAAVKDLAEKFTAKPAELIARLIKMGIFANINQSISFENAARLGAEFGLKVERAEAPRAGEDTKEEPKRSAAEDARRIKRPTIVTLMGHVDHGKTSLLDAIRKTRVVDREAGGITQHIGAYEVFLEKGAVTFLDTPGHEAFTEMRARGARVTDVVVLVIAADDGIMPQTEEAIDHARAADATIVVAINKTDLPSANPDKVRKELAEHDLLPEDWGGKTVTVNVSARTGKGIDTLLEMLLLESELLELKADPAASAKGIVIEAKVSKGAGPVATAIIQDGTLEVGEVIVCGNHYGRVRAMMNDRGQRVREASPSMPVEIAGLSGVPRAGETFYVVESEVRAREIIEEARRRAEEKGHITLEQVFTEIRAGHMKALKLIIKSDVQGSIEALKKTLGQIPTTEVQLQIIHTGTGNVSKSDVMLAAASNAVVVGFHVDIEPDAQDAIKLEQVDVRLYQIIYEVKSAIEKAVGGLLTPEMIEVFIGAAEVRQLFKVSKLGIVAGSMVAKGRIVRNGACRVLRGGKRVFEGRITGLKRFKDDVREVQEGFECGINIANYKDLLEGDRIEVYEIQSKTATPS